MIKGNLTEKSLEELEEELAKFELMDDYLQKTGQQKEKFTSLREAESLILIDGANPIKNIILMENAKGKTEILKRTKTEYDEKEIEELAKKTGLEKKDIIALLQHGMKLDEISEAFKEIPPSIKEISDSAVIREMIKKDINSEMLNEITKKGVQVVPMKDGSLQVSSLQKIAEVNEKGLLDIEPKLLKSLETFEQMGLIKLSSKLVVKEIEPQSRQREHGNSLKVVSLQEKEEDKTKDDIEKQKMAQGLGINSDEIVSIIRIDDKENGSKLLNDARGMDDGPVYIIRTRNGVTGNKFITARGTKEGGYEQIQGFESTPVSKKVASLLKDTQNSMNTVAIKPGEIRAGKMHSMDNKYRYFQIRRAGESKDDDSNTLLFVGTSGETDMSLIESREDGERQFVQLPVSSVHPSSIYLENNMGYGQKTELSSIAEDKGEQKPEITFDDINEKTKLLKRLKEIESKIVELEDQREIKSVQPASIETSETPEKSEEQNKPDEDFHDSKELDSLYTERANVLKQLGMDESKIIEEPEEETEMQHSLRPKY